MDFSKVKNWDDACNVNIPYSTSQNSAGNELETFLAGWVNAADMIDEGTLDKNDDTEVLRCVFSEFDNMGYKR